MNELINLLDNCQNGNHMLQVIYCNGYEDHEQTVVRWCSICGSIVVDIDHDGRRYSGKIMGMKMCKLKYEVLNRKD